MAFSLVLTVVIGYLFGNLNGAIIISRILMKEDVRTKGSGNAGLTNFLRSYGGAKTFLVLGIDAAKAVAGALIGGWLMSAHGMGDFGQLLGGFCVVLGHMFPVFFGFRGGKGVLSAGFLTAILDWRVFLVLFVVFVLVTAITRYVSLASCLSAVAFGCAFIWVYRENLVMMAMALVMAGLVIFMHRSNIKRLLAGQESKLSFGKK